MIQNYTTHYKLYGLINRLFLCLYNYSYLGTRQIIDMVK